MRGGGREHPVCMSGGRRALGRSHGGRSVGATAAQSPSSFAYGDERCESKTGAMDRKSGAWRMVFSAYSVVVPRTRSLP